MRKTVQEYVTTGIIISSKRSRCLFKKIEQLHLCILLNFNIVQKKKIMLTLITLMSEMYFKHSTVCSLSPPD